MKPPNFHTVFAMHLEKHGGRGGASHILYEFGGFIAPFVTGLTKPGYVLTSTRTNSYKNQTKQKNLKFESSTKQQ